jgi:hypothetical protein
MADGALLIDEGLLARFDLGLTLCRRDSACPTHQRHGTSNPEYLHDRIILNSSQGKSDAVPITVPAVGATLLY